MSWYSVGAEAAAQAAATMVNKRRRNFYVTSGERATIRFLAPATRSFNYKRSFVKWAKGEKMLTSPQTVPDPFVEAGLQLQLASAWWIIDRRIIEFKDKQTGEDKTVGPRILYFADGSRTRNQLIGFEKDQLVNINEDRAEDGKDALSLEEFNLTSYDVTVSKESKAPWNISAKRPKQLSKQDLELIEKSLGVSYDELLTGDKDIELLAEELKPLSIGELNSVLGGSTATTEIADDPDVTYSYEAEEEEEVISFD